MIAARIAVGFVLTALALPAGVRLLITVVDPQTGRPVTDLAASDFEIVENRTARIVERVEPAAAPVEILFLLDTSAVGAAVGNSAPRFIEALAGRERMALVLFDSTVTVAQEFTSDRDLLRRGLSTASFSKEPRLMDALYAALESGFPASRARKTILLLTAGIEGPSRIDEKDVIQLARNKKIAIYPVYEHGSSRFLFDRISRRTGGAHFSLREMKKAARDQAASVILDAVRSAYTVTLNAAVSEAATVKVKGREKLFASALPLD